jgi:hypothetical protein
VRRTGTRLLRRAVMWAAGAVLVLSVACWCPAGGLAACWHPRDRSWWIGVGDGCVWGGRPHLWQGSDSPGLPGVARPWYESLGWWPDFWASERWWAGRLPLWMPAAGSLLVLSAGLLQSRRERAGTRHGRCLSCAYDLTGVTALCPECGKEREA